MIYELSVSHYFALSQNAKTKPERVAVESRLAFIQSIKHNVRTRKLISNLALNQSVGLRRSITNVSVAHTLSLNQVVAKNPIEVSVIHTLFHWQKVQQPKWEKIIQSFGLTQEIVGEGCRAIKSNLDLTQTVVGNVVRVRNVQNTFNLVNGVSAYINNANFNYLNPIFTTIDKVRFKYGDYEFYVRKPDFDDTYSYDFTRISRRSRGGDLIISRDNIWPATKSFNIRFTYLSQEEVDKFLYFMKLTLGKRCRYLNYDNVEWEGFIKNPQTEVTQLGRHNFAITIEFEGEPIP